MFSDDEVERYARHLVLRDVGGPGQARLKAARVLVVGVGGLGAPLIQYLAAAGVGTIGLVDDDVVSLSNLQRQVLFSTADIGRPKVEAAADAIARLNPHVQGVPVNKRLDAANVDALLADFNVIAEGSDSFATRYLVSDAAFHAGKPLVMGALGQFDGSVTTLRPHETGADGRPNPTWRCLFPVAPPEDALPTCAQAGVLGAVVGVVGSLMAVEVVRAIVGFGDGLVGRLLTFDGMRMRFRMLDYERDPDNPLNGAGAGAGAVASAPAAVGADHL